MKILDCTIRDGGYYTNWDFDKELIDTYILGCNNLPLEYLEIGYRSIPLNGYLGEYFYLPIYVMERIKKQTNKKLVVILNEKDIRPNHVEDILGACKGLIDLVRIAIDPNYFERALKLAKAIKKMGFEVGFNVMYMSNWKNNKDFLKLLPEVEGIADYFYMVDSYGGVYPNDVKETISLVKSYSNNLTLGFHGHNNMELALINTLTAIEEGCEIVDATITGMGRGAGNLKTELLLTALNAKGQIDVDFNALTKVVDGFTKLQKEYEWGANLPYMVSGAHSLPQKKVMDWVGKRYYSFNSIIRALQNDAKGLEDNENIEKWQNSLTSNKVLIVGGGPSVLSSKEAIISFLNKNKDITVIHASSKNALSFNNVSNKQIFCLVGNEGHRMEEVFKDNLPKSPLCILPSSPRKMGTYIPNTLKNVSYELSGESFSDSYKDSHCAIALQIALELKAQNVYLLGFDGYSKEIMDTKAQELFSENSYLFDKFREVTHNTITSLNETSYDVNTQSIYSLL